MAFVGSVQSRNVRDQSFMMKIQRTVVDILHMRAWQITLVIEVATVVHIILLVIAWTNDASQSCCDAILFLTISHII
jgi:hypothetical protein